MAGSWAGISGRIRFGPQILGGMGIRPRPFGVTTGRWMSLGPVWIRLGSPSSWPGEDEAARMIEPVEP